MIEVYENSTETLTLTVNVGGVATDADGPVLVTHYDDTHGTLIADNVEATRVGIGLYEYTTPFAASEGHTHTRVVWNFSVQGEAAKKTDQVNFVRPYVSIGTILERYPEIDDRLTNDTSFSVDDIKFMERTVRGVIDSFTGTDFQLLLNRTFKVWGTDSEFLRLPYRILNLTSVRHGLTDLSLYVTQDADDPWTIYRSRTWGDTIKADVGYLASRARFFSDSSVYSVSGDWGWEAIPAEVNAAAILLIGSYYCDDAAYRERWVDNVRAADWRMEFKLTGDETTGNANADMMLTDFKNPGWVVI